MAVKNLIKDIFSAKKQEKKFAKIYALKLSFNEWEKRVQDFEWFLNKTKAKGVIKFNHNNSDMWFIYATDEERQKAYKIAQERYETVEIDNEYEYMDLDMLNEMVKDGERHD